jgi:hypothetical protein
MSNLFSPMDSTNACLRKTTSISATYLPDKVQRTSLRESDSLEIGQAIFHCTNVPFWLHILPSDKYLHHVSLMLDKGHWESQVL